MLLKPGLLLSVLALLVGCTESASPLPAAPPSTAPPAESAASSTPVDPFIAAELAAANAISGDRLRGIVAEIADDRYEGRAPGTAGDLLTRQYLIQQGRGSKGSE